MATLEGERTIDKAIKNIIDDEIDSLVIKPLFMIPGKHVISDIVDGDESIVNKLGKNNIKAIMKEDSLLQYEDIRQIFVRNIKDLVK